MTTQTEPSLRERAAYAILEARLGNDAIIAGAEPSEDDWANADKLLAEDVTAKGAELAEKAHARRGDRDTSKEAAAVATRRIRASQLEVLEVMVDLQRPIADRGLVAIMEKRGTKQKRSGIRTRRAELVSAGLVESKGRKGGHTYWRAYESTVEARLGPDWRLGS